VAAEPIGGHRPAGSASQDHDLLPRHARHLLKSTSEGSRARSSSGTGQVRKPHADNYAVERLSSCPQRGSAGPLMAGDGPRGTMRPKRGG
jgi:hypothetical protein